MDFRPNYERYRKVMKKKAYARAGVDLDQASRDKLILPQILQKTFSSSVIPAPHHFAGLFRAQFPKMKNPVLVASTDGVGSKLMLAEKPHHHAQIAVDLVNHCVNDILTVGAQPLFFLDYLCFKKWDSIIFRSLMRGFQKACLANSCAFLGGETAQLPDFFSKVKYDLSGTIIGVVDEKDRIDGENIKPGDAIIGLPSNGLHTNGYTLARKILFKDLKLKLGDRCPGTHETFGNLLRKPHRCYLPAILKLRQHIKIKGMAHITGGGLKENLKRILPVGLGAKIERKTWPIPPLFSFLHRAGRLSDEESDRVFNMGIGFVIITSVKNVAKSTSLVKSFYIGKME